MQHGPQVEIDLPRIAQNAAAVKALTGVKVYGVVKADGYGLGVRPVSRAIAEVVDGFYVFDLAEAAEAELKDLALKGGIIAMDQPWKGYTAQDYLDQQVRPIVHSAARARELAGASPVLAIDTGMRRFGCEPGEIEEALRAGAIREVMTHAVRMEQVTELVERCGGRSLMLHAAGSALLGERAAWLDAVRPGLAMYRGAARVTTRVVEARDVARAGAGVARAGYTQFQAERVGVVPGGYTAGMRAGVCLVRGELRRLYEVGMQSAYVELRSTEGVGEEVTLLGNGLTERQVADAWGVSEQEVLVRLCRTVRLHAWGRSE